LSFVDFLIRPHLSSTDFGDLAPEAVARVASKINWPLYAIDDNSGVLVDGDQIEVILEGTWQRFPPHENW
jgi:dipeptidase E